MGINRGCDSTYKICMGSNQPKSHRQGKWIKSSTPNQGGICNWCLLEKGKSVFPTVCHWLYQIYSRVGSVPRGKPTQMDSMFVHTCVPMFFDLFSLVWYFLSNYIFFLFVSFDFNLGSKYLERERTWNFISRDVEMIWEVLRERKDIIKTYCIKTF